MLVLSRRVGESIKIGDEIEIVVTRFSGARVSLAVDAPPEVPVTRSELIRRTESHSVGELDSCRRHSLPPR